MTISSYQTLIKAPGPNAPIVFAFHGMGGDEYQFAELTRQILPDAGVISPRGDVSEFGALPSLEFAPLSAEPEPVKIFVTNCQAGVARFPPGRSQ